MNSKLAKKIRQAQRKQLPDIPKEVDIAIEKAFLMGVNVGWKKERERTLRVIRSTDWGDADAIVRLLEGDASLDQTPSGSGGEYS